MNLCQEGTTGLDSTIYIPKKLAGTNCNVQIIKLAKILAGGCAGHPICNDSLLRETILTYKYNDRETRI